MIVSYKFNLHNLTSYPKRNCQEITKSVIPVRLMATSSLWSSVPLGRPVFSSIVELPLRKEALLNMENGDPMGKKHIPSYWWLF